MHHGTQPASQQELVSVQQFLLLPPVFPQAALAPEEETHRKLSAGTLQTPAGRLVIIQLTSGLQQTGLLCIPVITVTPQRAQPLLLITCSQAPHIHGESEHTIRSAGEIMPAVRLPLPPVLHQSRGMFML